MSHIFQRQFRLVRSDAFKEVYISDSIRIFQYIYLKFLAFIDLWTIRLLCSLCCFFHLLIWMLFAMHVQTQRILGCIENLYASILLHHLGLRYLFLCRFLLIKFLVAFLAYDNDSLDLGSLRECLTFYFFINKILFLLLFLN